MYYYSIEITGYAGRMQGRCAGDHPGSSFGYNGRRRGSQDKMTRKWLVAGCMAICPGVFLGQGFGAVKQSVTLERKLPSIVETDLIRNNNQLTPNPDAPDTVISIRVLNCSAASTPEYGMQFGKNAGRSQQPIGYKVAADLSVTYEARSRDGGFVDAEPLDVKYNQESNSAKAAITGLMGKADQEPHTAEELVQLLADRMAERIAARLVNTNERVEVLLGKGGPLDDANRYAVAGQWSKYVET